MSVHVLEEVVNHGLNPVYSQVVVVLEEASVVDLVMDA